MKNIYTYNKPVRSSAYSKFTRRLKIVVISLILILVGALFIIHALHAPSKNPPPISSPTNTIFDDNQQTYTSPYFKFKDTGGKWVLEKDRSTSNTFIYDKYQGQSILGQVIFYINHEADMTTGVTRVLPVRIVNDDSFQVTGVSDPCVNQYGPNEPHITKEVKDQDVLFYCDAGDDQYIVVVGQIGGDYHLNLKRSDGSPEQVEIVYKYNGPNPGQGTIINVVDSFQAT